MGVPRRMVLGLGMIFFLAPCIGAAQQPSTHEGEIARVSPDSLFELGRHAWSKRDTGQSLRHFERAFSRRPSLRSASGESVSHRLGRIYRIQGERHRALEVWKEGLEAQRSSSGPVDLRVADAVLRTLTDVGIEGQSKHACRAYREILKRVGTASQAPADTIIRRHVAQLAPILSESTLGSMVQEMPDDSVESWTFGSDAGERLLRWWRRHDTLPATKRNERMTEHLRRVFHAQQHFACSEEECRPEGWDERGAVYVRFGTPVRRESITYNDPDFNFGVFRAGVSVSRHAFPDNELWIYPHIDDFGQYIFVEKDGYYQIATANSLLPRRLRVGYGGRSDRSLNKAMSALAALRHIYKRLSLHHIRYGDRYNRIASYVSWQEEQAALTEMGALSSSRTRRVGRGVGQTKSVGPGPGATNTEYPNEFVSSHLQKSKVVDQRAAERREEEMPTEYNRRSEERSLPVAVRTARFLTKTGSTEVRIAWSHPTGALSLSEGTRSVLEDNGTGLVKGHLLQLHAVQYDPSFRHQKTSQTQYYVQQPAADHRTSPNVRTLSTGLKTDSSHVRLQWDHHVALSQERGGTQRGPLAKRSTKRLDSLAALRKGNAGLIMSDVMPGHLQEGAPPRRENVTPHPFSSIGNEEEITLYFELYRLALNEEGRTRYTVEYQIEQTEEDGGLFGGLFSDEEEAETRTELTYRGESPRAQELIKVDLVKWEDMEEGPLSITVRVTDEISGQHADRTIKFSMRE